MKTRERMLRLLSRRPEQGRYAPAPCSPDNALDELVRQFPGFLEAIAGKRVLDFGCGEGFQVLAMAAAGAAHVVGVDIHEEHLAKARDTAAARGLAGKAEFVAPDHERARGPFDLVLSSNSMEHYADPAGALRQMADLLGEGGELYVSFGPPWYSPWGAHTFFFCKAPWIHLLFPESVVMKVRADFTDDGAMRYEEYRGGLNRMSLAKFERLVAESGLQARYRKYTYVLNLVFLEKIPVLRELLIYHISVILAPD